MLTAANDEPEPPWEELLGSKNWDSLLDPLHLSLRKIILRCGDFSEATYDAFNDDQNSKFCGSSRYGKSSFFHKVMLESASDYRVESFLYATARVSLSEAFLLHSISRESWDRESNWIGYIATTTDETSKALGRREIYVVWRGATRGYEWINVLDAKLESVEPLLRSSDNDDENEKQPKVMLGWMTLYISDNPKSSFTKLSARAHLLGKIKELKQRYKDENISILFTGHSMGASLSILSAFDVVEHGLVNNIPVAAIVFGSPQVGNKAFDDRMKRYPNLAVLHIRNTIDVIPHYPSLLLGYVYTGTEFVIDTRSSPSLKDSTNPRDWHNLEAMLHVVAGWNGERGGFKLRVKRSLALVNKFCAFLKDECLVPGSWWVEKNKGMVRNDKGDWEMAPPTEEDLPTPE
ncbi:Phospholipase A1-IIdelta [Hibiscus syriacus]|uniref:Phospholipase A1 n=1 Tax=Hibiscus syriacus TaxID=106335 RepID=A0A6A3BUM1_HIBSY|nr:phospholipase A1-IIdelta-like [Hibiscus syriacus]KAE8718569.1 Phospholipase A1-IIdelta [Hibiscus syriacus]